MAEKMTKAMQILDSAIAYPPDGHPRRDEDGYPAEFVYDEFAYRRIVDTYRDAMRAARRALDEATHDR